MVVYAIKNQVNGKVYIGKTRYDLQYRWKLHMRSLKGGCKVALYGAMRKYGLGAFNIYPLSESISSLEDLNNQERAFIAEHQSYPPDLGFGYNMTPGGDGGPVMRGVKRSPESCARMREAFRGRGLGVPKSEEHRRKIGMEQMGEKNHRFGKPSVNRGQKPTKVTYAKMVEATKKRWSSEEYRKRHKEGLMEWNKARQDAALGAYLDNPMRCKRCSAVIIPKVLGKVTLNGVRKRQYCGNSCATSARLAIRSKESN